MTAAVAPTTFQAGHAAAYAVNLAYAGPAAATGTVSAGTYVVHDINILSGIAVNIAGPVTFSNTGNLNLVAGVKLLGTANATPSNFTVYVTTGGVYFLADLLQWPSWSMPRAATTTSPWP